MQAFLEFTERFGNMLSRIFLSLLYYLVLGPFAILYCLLADPLHLARQKRTNWWSWKETNTTLRRARRQD